MAQGQSLRVLTRLSATTCGAFRGADAVRCGVTRRQLVDLVAYGAAERLLPDTY